MTVHVGSADDLGVQSISIQEFYRDNWARPICLSDNEFYQWQFVDNPYDKGVDNCCVAVDKGDVVGVMGLNERDFFLKGELLKGAELTTWVVSENYRSKGIGPKMISFLKEKYSVMVGMGISQDALPVYLRSGFRYSSGVPRFVKVINWDNISDYTETTPLAKKYAKSQSKREEYKKIEWNDTILDDLFSKFGKKNNCFSRTHRDVFWRYDEHPVFDYEKALIETTSGDRCFVVYRVDRDIGDMTMMHCVEILGDEGTYCAAASYLEDIAKEKFADAVDIYTTKTSLVAAFRYCGWFSTLDDSFFKFPHLFHPVEIREPATTSLILWAKENILDLLDFSKLHITKQDADFDRPTLHGRRRN